jgi:hypothetical protein
MTQEGSKITSMPPLTAQDVCQVLKDITLKRRTMKRACAQSWDEIFAGLFHIEVEGWQLVIFNDCGELDYCDEGISPDGRRWSFESVASDGFDPIFLLSTQEQTVLKRLLQEL